MKIRIGFKKSKGGLLRKQARLIFQKHFPKSLTVYRTVAVVCDKINHTMERYADVLLCMWANDEKFKEKFNKSKGVCLKHMKLLIDTVPKSLKETHKPPNPLPACLKARDRTFKNTAGYINSHLNSLSQQRYRMRYHTRRTNQKQSTKFQVLSIMTMKNKSEAIMVTCYFELFQ